MEAKTPEPRGVAARTIFGHLATPAALTPRAIGSYARGCLAGAKALPIDGEVWQAMRLSRNRNWGHPKLIALIERLAEDGAAKDGWPGLLVGDISQPRGGPMLSDHASHQIGLDADIWFTPMPYRRLTYREREEMPFTSMLGKDGMHVDPEVFTAYHDAIVRRAASYSEVERIFVHPGIKKAMCENKTADRTYLYKIRPTRGHNEHFHIRMACPAGSTNCRAQPEPSEDDGCGRGLEGRMAWARIGPPAPVKPVVVAKKPPRRVHQVTLDDLPDQCREVAESGQDGHLGSVMDVKGAVLARKP